MPRHAPQSPWRSNSPPLGERMARQRLCDSKRPPDADEVANGPAIQWVRRSCFAHPRAFAISTRTSPRALLDFCGMGSRSAQIARGISHEIHRRRVASRQDNSGMPHWLWQAPLHLRRHSWSHHAEDCAQCAPLSNQTHRQREKPGCSGRRQKDCPHISRTTPHGGSSKDCFRYSRSECEDLYVEMHSTPAVLQRVAAWCVLLRLEFGVVVVAMARSLCGPAHACLDARCRCCGLNRPSRRRPLG